MGAAARFEARAPLSLALLSQRLSSLLSSLLLLKAVHFDQMLDTIDVCVFRFLLRQALLLVPRVPLCLALQVQEARTSYGAAYGDSAEGQGESREKQEERVPVVTSPSVACLNSAYSCSSSSSVGRDFSFFTFAAASSNSFCLCRVAHTQRHTCVSTRADTQRHAREDRDRSCNHRRQSGEMGKDLRPLPLRRRSSWNPSNCLSVCTREGQSMCA